jgi:hypothetical protein
MKRIIEGRTYNTDTSTIVEMYNYVDDKGYDTEVKIYRNTGGAYFAEHKADGKTRLRVEALSRDDLDRVIANQQVDIIDEEALANRLPPEAAEEADTSAPFYLRAPMSLKERVEAVAREANLSANAWVLRCIQNCLHSAPEARARASANESVEFKVARPDSLRGLVAAYMKEHAREKMIAVLPGIQQILAIDGKPADPRKARGYYRWCVENGYGPGVVERLPRT